MSIFEQLTHVLSTKKELRHVRTLCPYCGVGCGLSVGVDDKGRAQTVKGDPHHPANFGMICEKAATLLQTVDTSDRLHYPEMRESRYAPRTRVHMNEAIKFSAKKMREIIQRDGPDAVGFYISGQLSTEDYYVINKFAKGFLGTNNVDANSRLCMSSAVAAYTSTLGSDSVPCCYEDIEHSDCFFIVGANMADCHPITHRRVLQQRRNNNLARTIVVDPRKTNTTQGCDLHLPVTPGGDVPLLLGMLRVLIAENLIHRNYIAAHTRGFESLERAALDFSLNDAAARSGCAKEKIIEAAHIFGRADHALTFWSMGVNQSTAGVDKSRMLIALHLATGKIGRRGCGPFSLTGQPNAMGGREAGGLAHLLPGHRLVTCAQDRMECEKLWQRPAGSISSKVGLTAVEMVDALVSKKLKAIWIVATNPAVSMPELLKLRRGFAYAEFVALNEIYSTAETAVYADVLLPAAGWSEKTGTMTNSERTITLCNKINNPPGEALPDWRIFAMLAAEMGFGEHFAWRDESEIRAEFTRMTVGRDLDMSGIDYAGLSAGPLQWPKPKNEPSTPRLFSEGKFFTPDEKAVFFVPEIRLPVECPDSEYPFWFNTGRLKGHWHTMTRTSHVRQIMHANPEPRLQMHPDDALRLELRNGGKVEVRSRRGRLEIAIEISDKTPRGSVFAPMHWGRRHGLYASINALTTGAMDTISKQPELKACAVSIHPLR
jgi:anaerobic selenocysteine-containing dehydrogenase